MSEFFQANAQVIQQRWPALFARLVAEDSLAIQAELVQGLGSTLSVDGIQLTSRHDRIHEARVQAASLPQSLACTSTAPALGTSRRCCWSEPYLSGCTCTFSMAPCLRWCCSCSTSGNGLKTPEWN